MTTTNSGPVAGRKLTLSHLGIGCFDLARMEDFYTRVLGMTVSDPPTQWEMQQIANKLDELISALRR